MRIIEVGQIKAVYGVKGWVKLFSFTRPIEQIFDYQSWRLKHGSNWIDVEVEQTKQRSNSGLIAKIKGIDSREQAQTLTGKMIAVAESELKPLDEGEYYWSQLIGLQVVNTQDEILGEVTELLETGANDVLVVKNGDNEQLIPYASSIVLNVDIETQQLTVDWEADF